jgi:2-dehydro-3-deoxyglucarate aldolase
MEHGSISINQIPNLFRAIELGNTLPLARIAQPHPKDCKQALDAGAGGIIVPMIENAEQLEIIKEACRWPPEGSRGVGFSRANLFGKYFEEYKIEAQKPLFVVQIENINAVKNLEDILQVNGLDAVMVGPYDLSASLGIVEEFDNKKYITTINEITKLCKKYRVPIGDHIVTPSKEIIKERIRNGFQFIAYSTDGVFLNSSSQCPEVC